MVKNQIISDEEFHHRFKDWPKFENYKKANDFDGLRSWFDSLSSQRQNYFLEYYLEKFKEYELFFLACRSRRASMVEFAVRRGVDVNIKGTDGRTPLHEAVIFNEHQIKPSLLSLLLGNSLVKVNVQDALGKTPLHWAVEKNDESALIQLLACQRITPNIADYRDYLPLHYTCFFYCHYTPKRIAHRLMDDILNRTNLKWDLLTSRYGGSILHWAVQYGHAELVAEMLSHGSHTKKKLFGINQENSVGATALFVAATMPPKYENIIVSSGIEICKCLITRGASIEVAYNHVARIYGNVVNHQAIVLAKSTLLLCAIQCGSALVLPLDIPLGNVVDVCVTNGNTHVHEAVRHNKNCPKPSILGRLLESDPVKRYWINATNRIGLTPLHVAVAVKDESAVKQLLECDGIRPSTANIKQELPLHYACLYYVPSMRPNTASIARLLLDDIWKRKNLHSDSLMHWNLLSKKSNSILHCAISRGHAKLVAEILSHEVCNELKLIDVNQQNQYGQSALSIAAKHGQREIFKCLLDHGANADADLRDISGRPLLEEVVLCGDTEIFKALLSSQAYKNLADFPTKSIEMRRVTKRALHIACRLGQLEIVRHVLENYPIELDLSDNMPSFLNVAIKHDHKPIVEYIINESFLWTPLFSKHFMNGDETRDSAMRQLVRSMPDVALTVLDKCKKKNEREVTYYYCFCDDECTTRIPHNFPKIWSRENKKQTELDLEQLGWLLQGYQVGFSFCLKSCSLLLLLLIRQNVITESVIRTNTNNNNTN